jgi:hypothetical protein
MTSPALALTSVPISGGTGAGANTGQPVYQATVITRCVRTQMETGERGTGVLRGPLLAGSALLPPFLPTAVPPASTPTGAAHD